MDVIRVSNDGLQALAAQHEAASAEVARSTPDPAVGPIAQSTAAAVAGGYEALQAAAGVLAARLETTGLKLSSAGNHFAAREASSVRHVADVGSVIET